MTSLLGRIGLLLAANAIGLLVAALVLDDMSMDGWAFFLAIVIFTAAEALALVLVRNLAEKYVPAVMGAVTLIATYLGLLITDVVSDGLNIEGWWTWALATLIVWVVSMIATAVLPLFFGGDKRTS